MKKRLDPLDAGQANDRFRGEFQQQGIGAGKTVADHRRHHDDDHETGAQRNASQRHARWNARIGQPVRETFLQDRVCPYGLAQLHGEQRQKSADGDQQPGFLQLLGLQTDITDGPLQGLDGAPVDIDLVGIALDGGQQLLASQFQGPLDGGDAVPRLCGQVAEQTADDLHQGEGLDDEEGEAPVPQPSRGIPDRTEEAGPEV